MQIEMPVNQALPHWKRILLIEPNYRTMGWEACAIEMPPINLTYIAAYIEDLDVEVAILDAKVKNLNFKEVKKQIQAFHPDLVGISVFVSAAIRICNEYAKIVKEVNLHCTVVFGGRHPTWEPDETLKIKDIDILVRGEGELTFRELIQQGNPENVLSVSYRIGEKIIHNEDRPLLNINNIRLPARHLTKEYKYQLMTFRLETVETSRGCPYSCNFCTTHKFNKGLWRPRPIVKVIQELKLISQNRAISDIFFVDDNLTHDRNRIEELCDQIIACKKTKEINDFRFFAQIRVDSVVKSPQMIKKMAEAGFWVVFIGIEGVSDTKLKLVRKGFTFDKVLQALQILHEHNIIVIGNLILGLDLNETEENLRREIQFMKKVDIDIVSYVLLTPFPGSDVLKDYDKQGLVLTKDWSKYTVFQPVIRTYALNPQQLLNLLYYSFRELKYVRSLLMFSKRIFRTRKLHTILKPTRLVALIQSYLRMKALCRISPPRKNIAGRGKLINVG